MAPSQVLPHQRNAGLEHRQYESKLGCRGHDELGHARMTAVRGGRRQIGSRELAPALSFRHA
jgi:hypothetical protein